MNSQRGVRTVWRCLGRLVCWVGLCLIGATALAQNIESVLRPGDLIKGHAKWDEECTQCHVRFNRDAQNERCMDCHKDVGADMRGKTGMHGRLKPQACRSCHTDHKGRNARIVDFDPKKFDHAQSDYTLRGKHQRVECDKCHVAGKKYSQAAQDCLACHRKDDTHKGSLGTKCADCHTEVDWKQTNCDHDKTRFALTGKHVDTKCADCHKNASYKDTARTCIGCHRKDDDGAKGHRGRYGEKCESCHNAKAWKPSTFNHDNDTRYALRGKHRTASCSACHTGHLFKDKLGSACLDCHRKDDKHEGSLGRECQACHTERDWKETQKFDHDKTRFALLGKHRDVKCDDCHKGGKYKDTAQDCVGCHKKDDKHQPSLGTDCQACHSERDWKETSRFDHQRSKFPLLGKHRDTKCAECHKPDPKAPGKLIDYRAAASDCYACHKKDDKHEGNVGTKCADCHGEQDWKAVPKFDHQRTRFPLRQAHAARTVQCKDCHANLRSYRDIPRDCLSCHKKDDKHEGQLGERCESCHDELRWKNVRYDHAKARFVLLGKHLAIECGACHKTLRYRDAPRDCDGCHRKDDKHALKFGTACESCHNARNWRLWTYDHNRKTKFVLDGAHVKTPCEKCHTAPAPKGKAIADVGGTCLSCHQRDDKHDGAFGPQCDRCHTTTDWRQVTNRGAAAPKPTEATPGWRVAAALGRASWLTASLSLRRMRS